MIRVLVVDDEPVARRTIIDLLACERDVEVVAACPTGDEALRVLSTEDVDVVFLDIEMPGILGLEVPERMPGGVDPLVVFVTAHAAHALEAFELSALDYVLKPFDDDRLARAVQRARARLAERRAGALGTEMRLLARSLSRVRPSTRGGVSGGDHGDAGSGGAPAAGAERLAVRSLKGVEFIDPEQILWVEAEDSYVRLHLRTGRFRLMRETMTRLEVRLAAFGFIRVHRSAIVRISQVERMEALDHGDARLELAGGTLVRVSRTRRAAVEAALGL